MKLFIPITFILLLAAAVSPQTPAIDYGKLREALTRREYRAAADQLRVIKATQPSVFAADNLDYLLGRMLEKTGDPAGAIQNFESVRKRNSVLKEYALWHLSSLARSTGNLFLERIYLNELGEFDNAGLMSAAARERLAGSFLESGDPTAAIRLLSDDFPGSTIFPKTQRSPGASTQRKRLLMLAKAHLLAGNSAAALDLFNELITSATDPEQPDDFALAAVKGLDYIDSRQSSAVLLTYAEHFRRAGVYQFNRDFDNARGHYLAILENHPSSPIAARSEFNIGRSYAQQSNFVDAVQWFERGQQQTTDPAVEKESLLNAASAYARLGKHREAILRYQNYIQKYPEEEAVDRAYLNIIDALRDGGEETAAIQHAQKVQETFRGKQTESLAIFSEARVHIARSDWQNAAAALEKLSGRQDLGGAAVAGGTTSTEVAFLRGYVLEQSGNFAQAIDFYLSTPSGVKDYYGGLATEHLQDLAAQTTSKDAVDAKLVNLLSVRTLDPVQQVRGATDALRLTISDADREKLFATIAQAYSKLPGYKKPFKAALLDAATRQILSDVGRRPQTDRHKAIADELIFLGLYDEAAPEYEAGLIYETSRSSAEASRQTALPANAAYTLAELYSRGDRGDRAAVLFRTLWNVPADYPAEMMDPEYARFIYPAPYKDLLLLNAQPRGVDPRFLLAIIRQESGFRPNVKSNAAARGLMQFISTTARQTAQSLSRPDFRDDDLYDPRTSILFGSRYTEQLFALFPGLPDAVAAAYNGGEDNMKRWLARSRSRTPERYVPEISFAQSKDYVHRVISNYRVYQMLYDENLDAKPATFRSRER